MTEQSIALIFCGNGFAFNEIFHSVIEDLFSAGWKINVLLADYYLADHSFDSAKKLLQSGKISSYEVINPFGPPPYYSIYEHPRSIRSLLKMVKKINYQLLLLGSDFGIFDRYLIHDAKTKKAKTIVIQTGVLTTVLEYYRAAHGLNNKMNTPLMAAINKPKKQQSKLKIGLKKIRIFWEKYYFPFKNNYLLPFLYARILFPRSPYDKLLFSSGRGDAVICYDELEANALKEMVPGIKNVMLAKHPSSDLCKCASNSNTKKDKIICLMAGPVDQEMENTILDRWIKTIKRATNILRTNKIDLRFHPRTEKALKWPEKLINALKNENGFEIEVIDSMKVSLPESICGYALAIGAMSGSLRVARSACNTMPVIGLPNCSTFYDTGDDWILGEAQGIILLSEDEELNEKHLKVNYKNPELPTVAEILMQMI